MKEFLSFFGWIFNVKVSGDLEGLMIQDEEMLLSNPLDLFSSAKTTSKSIDPSSFERLISSSEKFLTFVDNPTSILESIY